MGWNRACAAVIPCYDEAAHIGRVVSEIKPYLARVIVVDDGSRDETAAMADDAGAEVIRLNCNSGKGAALREGWRRAGEQGFQWMLMLDGDGQHAAEDIPRFFHRAETTGAHLVVGNRMGDPGAMPWLRRQVNRWMSRRISQMTGADLPDSQCGFRLARLDTLQALSFQANRFEIESAMLAAFLAAGKKVEFVPVQTIYAHRGQGSKINPLTDSWRWLRWRQAQRAPLRACNTIRVP